MNVWFTSDLHIGHKKVAEIRFPELILEYASHTTMNCWRLDGTVP